jgi:acetyl-CoA synthetase
VLEWDEPFARWFGGGETNMSANCLDRHLEARGEETAILWEGEPGDVRRLSYRELHAEVSRFANALKSLGVASGDRVTIYLPMVPEAAVAMLACARLGAAHSVVFGGFSAGALADRLNDAGSKVLVTADGSYRRGAIVPLKHNVDEALESAPAVEAVVVLRRTGHQVAMKEGRDRWYHELVAGAAPDCPPEPLEAEHPLSSSTPPARRGSPRASSTRRAATWSGPTSRPSTSSTCARPTSTGAPPTSAG